MDSIKFMTRAGTGRCQGGFCSSRVMKIIEKEAGVPLEKITKKGPGSEILLLPSVKGQPDKGQPDKGQPDKGQPDG
jgi:glycerol-3-phosphate dehydrogenase